ncbi:hypothetical protein [Mucilaginibacter ginkgonis]|uniref:Uncharacterized protein n=1 Tax=Mucilaginibacter ginkgonis TaxID=2682091 RepID=A0A6I4I3Z7_9SPHI|nr:hypothetical protein [Mucilaginibacter ginkgonis]QQL48782.1 hypothetical protein GO620_011400 [Mucilaginibacter ginkgonis]
MLKYTLVLILFITSFSYAQQMQPFHINQVAIIDSNLIKGINYSLSAQKTKTSVDTNTENPFDKGFGYFEVRVKEFKGDTVLGYNITPSAFIFKKNNPKQIYPDYYGYVNGQLVLIYNEPLYRSVQRNLTDKEKGRFIKMLDKHLEKPQKATFYDSDHRKVFTDKNYRVDYFSFDAGINLYVLKNGSTVIVKDKGQF